MDFFSDIFISSNFAPAKVLQDRLQDNKVFKGLGPSTGRILYRWWFPENSKIFSIVKTYYTDEEINNLFTSKIISGKKYYALYLGKGLNGRRRLKSHLKPKKRFSTLRRTIASIIQDETEQEISEQLRLCYFEWTELFCTKEELIHLEEKTINENYYPFNISENKNAKLEWLQILKRNRKNLKTIKHGSRKTI